MVFISLKPLELYLMLEQIMNFIGWVRFHAGQSRSLGCWSESRSMSRELSTQVIGSISVIFYLAEV